MMTCIVNYSRKARGQLKIQQMAFVLVAIMIFFAIVSLVYFTIRINSLEEGADDLQDREARELVRKLAATPEVKFGVKSDCDICVDYDKLLVLKDRQTYQGFWNLDYLMVERIGEGLQGECSVSNSLNCREITIIASGEDFGATSKAFVALCSWNQREGGFIECELARIYASGRSLNG